MGEGVLSAACHVALGTIIVVEVRMLVHHRFAWQKHEHHKKGIAGSARIGCTHSTYHRWGQNLHQISEEIL